MKTCSIEGCNLKHKGLGLCNIHYNRKYHIENREKELEYKKQYRIKNREKIKEYNLKSKPRVKKWLEENKERLNTKWRKYYLEHIEHKRIYDKRYNKMNNVIDRRNERIRERLRKDTWFRLNNNVRNLLWQSLKGNKNGRNWAKLIGYTIEDLKNHLEKQFDDKISWNNYGSYWVIDHIIPLYCYKASSEEILLKRGWALKNLRPLEKITNIKKSNKLELINYG